jgi:hypothetical protein
MRVLEGKLAPAGPVISSAKGGRFHYPVPGLLGGHDAPKGVIIAESVNEAEKALVDIMQSKVFGASGDKVVIEERRLRTDDNAPVFQTGLTQDSINRVYGLTNTWYKDVASWDADYTALLGDWSTVYYSVGSVIPSMLISLLYALVITERWFKFQSFLSYSDRHPIFIVKLSKIAI